MPEQSGVPEQSVGRTCSGWAITPRTGGRPSQGLAGDHPEDWRATIPRTGGRPSRRLAGDHPKNWRATHPKSGFRPLRRAPRPTLVPEATPCRSPTPELAGPDPRTERATIPRTGGRPTRKLAGGLHTLARGSVTSNRQCALGGRAADTPIVGGVQIRLVGDRR